MMDKRNRKKLKQMCFENEKIIPINYNGNKK